MKTKLTFAFILVFFAFTSFGQKKELKSITENDLRAHLEFIASDYMQGRDFGTDIPGLEITAEYLKAQCKKLGLKPGGNDYFQPLEMISIKPDKENTVFQLKNSKGEVYYENKNILSFGQSAKTDTVQGEIVFAGYGWYNEETGYNDTKDLDIKGKIVLIMTRNLESVGDSSKNELDFNQEMKKLQKAAMGGAKALIMVPDPLNPDKETFNMIKSYISSGIVTLKGAKGQSMNLPVKLIFGTGELANEILKETGKTLAQIQKEINESGEPKSFPVAELKANIHLAKKSEEVISNNVIGIVEGRDPELKNECIVFTAHYDHVGVNQDGTINNGADDNGTGTVALLEIAEAFMQMKKKPKRSIVFAWVTAEEKGLIGSDYYSQNPVVPLEKTLANINLDMVGRSAEKEPAGNAQINKSLAGPNGIYIVSAKQSSDLMRISDKYCEELGLVPSDKLTKAFLTRSDYFHFFKNGIPILGLSTGLHEDYHKASDELDKIDYHKMKRVAQYCFLVANEVANQKKRIVVDNPANQN